MPHVHVQVCPMPPVEGISENASLHSKRSTFFPSILPPWHKGPGSLICQCQRPAARGKRARARRQVLPPGLRLPVKCGV